LENPELLGHKLPVPGNITNSALNLQEDPENLLTVRRQLNFSCLTGLVAFEWQFGEKFSFNRSAEE
jgi:hypothetical protein